MPQKTDDPSIPGSLVVYRRIQSQYLSFDINGDAVLSRGAFRTAELSLFRSDQVSRRDVLDGYPGDALTEITVQDIRDAGCIVVPDEPPPGHICAYRADSPRKSHLQRRICANVTRSEASARAPKAVGPPRWAAFTPP